MQNYAEHATFCIVMVSVRPSVRLSHPEIMIVN